MKNHQKSDPKRDPLGPNMASKISQVASKWQGLNPGGHILCGPADESCFRYRQSLAGLNFEWFWEGFFGVSSSTLSVFCCTSFCRAHPILWIDFLKMLGSLLLESVAGLLLYSVRRAQSMLVYASFGNISIPSKTSKKFVPTEKQPKHNRHFAATPLPYAVILCQTKELLF